MAPSSLTAARLRSFRPQLDAFGIDAFLVTFQPHLRYLTGFSGSSGAGLVTRTSAVLITDGRYATQAREEVRGWRILITIDHFIDALRRRKLLAPGQRVGIDGNTLPYAQYRRLKKSLPGVVVVPLVDCLEPIAAVKQPDEIEKIRKAVAITDTVFGELLPLIKPGVRELDLAAEISYRQKKHGAEADAFEAIVASGERSAFPHGRPTGRKLRRGDLLTLDFGCVVDGYHSDLTRTVAIGKISSEGKKIYSVVLEAQTRAIENARSGVLTKDLDAVARQHIKSHGYEKYYHHSLGHGIGLQIHEPPRISLASTAVLQPGNVVTIEPGVYIRDFGGVRIEDDVVICNGHCEVLSRSPKKLMIL